jgi:hypothetical protein
VYASQWGGSDRVLASVTRGRSPLAVSGIDWRRRPEPVEFDRFVASLDYLSTAMVYREHGATTAFLPLWFGLPLADHVAPPTAGTLVAVRSVPEARALRQWFRRLKGRLADALLTGHLPLSAAPLVLSAAVLSLRPRELYGEGFSERTGPDGP